MQERVAVDVVAHEPEREDGNGEDVGRAVARVTEQACQGLLLVFCGREGKGGKVCSSRGRVGVKALGCEGWGQSAVRTRAR